MDILKGQVYTFYKDSINISDIVEKLRKENSEMLEDSFLICDLSDVIKKMNYWNEYFPRVKPFYAVKCNNFDPISELLGKLGANFDCASKGEIAKMKSLGIASDRIIYAMPNKQISHLKYAKEVGVKQVTFDNECELHKIKEYYPDAELIIRIRYDARNSLAKHGNKFGCDPEKEAPELMKIAKRLGLKVVGVCFHIGFLCEDYEGYGHAIVACKKVFDVAESIGFSLEVLDIGGGFTRDVSKLQKVAKIVNQHIDTLFPNKNIKIIAEPGNYFVSSAFTLIAKIHSTRDYIEDGILKKMYYINAGYHNAFCSLSNNEIPTKPIFLTNNDGPLFPTIIWGPTCDPKDKIFENIMLPKLNVDDILIFPDLGSYTISIRNTFNSHPLPSINIFMNIIHKEIAEKLNTDIMKPCST